METHWSGSSTIYWWRVSILLIWIYGPFTGTNSTGSGQTSDPLPAQAMAPNAPSESTVPSRQPEQVEELEETAAAPDVTVSAVADGSLTAPHGTSDGGGASKVVRGQGSSRRMVPTNSTTPR